MIDDLKIIRKKYGEKMYHFCREAFPILLEEPGKLSKLLIDNFHESHSLYNDIEEDEKLGDFKNYIYSLVDVENNNALVENKTPEELMAEAGYNLFECYSEEDVQSYKKYYAPGEALCTFNGGRLNSCRVFFAVKKNVSDIKREDFKYPTRQDEYGTSVISIQFEKDGANTLSIKNRYNHTVNNPDATFSNNLDNIIPGLTDSFEKYKGIIQRYKNNSFEISNYVRANDGKFYKYNYEIDNVYYCPDNIIIDNFEVKKYDKSRYLIIDYFIIDMSKDNRSINSYDKSVNDEREFISFARKIKRDSFCDAIKEIKKIDIENTTDGKRITILGSNDEYLEILVDNDGKIISLKMDNVYDVGNYFLYKNNSLQELCAPNLTSVGNRFLDNNNLLRKIEFPNLIKVGNSFLWKNVLLEEVNLPKLEVVGNYFLDANTSLQRIELPNLMKVGDKFLHENVLIRELYMPKLTVVGDEFLYNNTFRGELNLSNLEIVGDYFMFCNDFLQELYAPNLTTVGDGFLYNNVSLHKLYVPKLKAVGNWFLCNNLSLSELYLPSLITVYNKFLYCNEYLQKLYAPNLKEVGDKFLYGNDSLQELYIPKIAMIGNYFLYCNTELRNRILLEMRMRNENSERKSR